MDGFRINTLWGLGAVLGISASLLLASAEGSEPTSSARSPGVLLLYNGNLLEGTISKEEGIYVLTTPTSEIRIRSDRVLFAGESPIAAYEYQRSQMTPATADRHLELAAWCLRKRLWPQMARELMDARSLDASPVQLARLEQQLEVATTPSRHKETSGEDLVELTHARTAQRKALEAVPRQISDEAFEQFMRKVQPILVNNCATSGCHQSGGKQEFQLDRSLVHGQGNRQTTLRNLAAALELINHDVPMRSQLLTVPVSPHGGAKQPVFSSRQVQLRRQLEIWVRLVTRFEDPELMTAGAEDESQQVDRAIWIVPEGEDESVYRRVVPLSRAGASAREKKVKASESDGEADE